MADEPSKTPGTPAERPAPQIIPLSKIHDLPGVFIPKLPDKSYGGLVSSIQAGGVKEPVILRLREDGEYQLVAGYRRRRGSELAKQQDIPAYVYEMTLQEAVDYRRRVQNQPALPIPGKLVNPTAEKKAEQPAPAKDSPAPKEGKAAPATPAADTPKSKEQPSEGKTEPKPDGKAADTPKEPAPAKDGPAPKEGKAAPAAPAAAPNPKEPVESKTEVKPIVTGPTAKGPAGTQITQVFEDRLAPPDEKALNDLPSPKEGESYFIVLHPGYLEKSKYNTITVDRNSEDYRELKNGVKDPVLTRINPEGGGLEIVSGQRRHMIAKELNYPVPAIIQKLDDADVKILVNDGNLHRPHISTYDLARALRDYDWEGGSAW